MNKITTCLWFDKEAEDAAKFYVSIFKNSKMGTVMRYDKATAEAAHMPEGTVLTASFTLENYDILALNGGPIFKFSEAISLVVHCEDQAEIDYYWEKLSAHPENEQCGWLKDKFGLSWQIVPKDMDKIMTSPKSSAALMKMKKISIDGLINAK